MSYSLVVFDWDGTLMDSTHSIVAAIQGACRDLELAVPSASDASWVIGLSLESALRRAVPELTQAMLPRFLERYRTHYLLRDPELRLFDGVRELLTELAAIWHDYRSRVWRTPVVRRLRERRFRTADYLNWMENWIPQVREGSKWMREGAASLSGQYAPLAALIDTHAGEEQNDFQILFNDYRKAGGAIEDIDALRRNPGGEALNAYLHGLAATRDPIGLLGAIYIIEGTGQRIVPALLPLLKASLALPPDAFRFLEYHGHNDEHHLARWLSAVELALDCDEDGRAGQRIVDTARRTAALYLMQFHHVMEDDAS